MYKKIIDKPPQTHFSLLFDFISSFWLSFLDIFIKQLWRSQYCNCVSQYTGLNTQGYTLHCTIFLFTKPHVTRYTAPGCTIFMYHSHISCYSESRSLQGWSSARTAGGHSHPLVGWARSSLRDCGTTCTGVMYMVQLRPGPKGIWCNVLWSLVYCIVGYISFFPLVVVRHKRAPQRQLPKQKNDIYVNKRSDFKCQLERSQKLLDSG